MLMAKDGGRRQLAWCAQLPDERGRAPAAGRRGAAAGGAARPRRIRRRISRRRRFANADRAAPPADNRQTSEAFAAEAARVAAATCTIKWRQPSRGEGDAPPLSAEPTIFAAADGAEEVAPEPLPEVAGGASRGTILHKLIEEVLTGETPEDRDSRIARATELAAQLAVPPAVDPGRGIATAELAATVERTLGLPEIAALRPRLVPEYAVPAGTAAAGSENLVSGVADAVAIDGNGALDTVIDWKSDVAPSPALLDRYRNQLRDYCGSTGARRCMLVFMSIAKVIVTRY